MAPIFCTGMAAGNIPYTKKSCCGLSAKIALETFILLKNKKVHEKQSESKFKIVYVTTVMGLYVRPLNGEYIFAIILPHQQ